VSFAAITLCVASKRVFIVVNVYFVIDSVLKLFDTPSYTRRGAQIMKLFIKEFFHPPSQVHIFPSAPCSIYLKSHILIMPHATLILLHVIGFGDAMGKIKAHSVICC
jgi:hypothetical protein